MNVRVVIVLLALLTIGAATASAQQRGQYILGTNGLNAGIQPPPGFTYWNQFTAYGADRLKGNDGQPIPTAGTSSLLLDQNLFIYTSKLKLFGGTYGAAFDLILANGSVEVPVIGLKAGGAGLSDSYVQPFTLGYHFPRIDFSIAYGFVAPTGRFTPGGTGNTGSGHWGHLPSLAGTVYLTKDKLTQISLFSAYEFHGTKRYTDIRPGQTFNLEWGLGRSWPIRKNILQLGVIGYGQWQTSKTTGSVPDVVADSRYSIIALGEQATFIVPKWNLNLFFKYEPEFNAVARVEGTTLSFGGSITFPVPK